LLSDYLESGQLEQVLSDYPSLSSAPVYAVYPARQGLALKTACFVQFLVEHFA